MPPTAPAKPPSPTTEPTAWRGNVSDASVKRFADHPWCAAAAMLTNATEPHAARGRRECDRHDGQRAREHGDLAPRVDVPPSLDQRGRQPAAADAADVGNQIDREERRTDRLEIDAVVAVQEVRNPEQVQPPHGIGHELADRERPRLAVLQQHPPRHVHRRIGRIAADVRELGGADARVAVGPPAQRPPRQEPQETERPVMRNVQYQPQRSVSHGTMNAAARTPTFVPELKRPVASARSRLGTIPPRP
jgi:hypothetical protein